MLITSLFALAVAMPTVAAEPPKIGEIAPEFSLVDTNGKSHNFSDFRGKIVVLEWTNDGCPYVMKHYGTGNMQKAQKTATDQGVVWLSIVSSAKGKQGYVEGPQGNALMKEKGFKSTALLLDPDGKVGKLYQAKTTPHMFVLDASGKVAYMGAIDDKATPFPESVKGARNYVLEAITALKAGKTPAIAATQPYGCSVKYGK
ncbi:resA Thiol-disulfide oxidoreductase ResA [Fimbriimonadaceae bacterium]